MQSLAFLKKTRVLVFTNSVFIGKEKLREAAKGRLRRMCAVHKKKQGLNVPDWVKEQWNKDQSGMAKMLMDANWDKDHAYIHVTLFVFCCNCNF